MKASPGAYSLIKMFEGLKYHAYKCPAGVWTIGYGHTGSDVRDGMVITLARAEELLCNDVTKAEGVINRYGLDLTQYQYDALVSLVYNIGPLNFAVSTLLKRLRGRQYMQAADEFPKWVKGGEPKHTISGLVKRRAAERTVFIGGTSEVS